MEALETYAYNFFSYRTNPYNNISNMKFDVIVGKSPYQLSVCFGTRRNPHLSKFVEQAKKLKIQNILLMHYSCLRWYSGGKREWIIFRDKC